MVLFFCFLFMEHFETFSGHKCVAVAAWLIYHRPILNGCLTLFASESYQNEHKQTKEAGIYPTFWLKYSNKSEITLNLTTNTR